MCVSYLLQTDALTIDSCSFQLSGRPLSSSGIIKLFVSLCLPLCLCLFPLSVPARLVFLLLSIYIHFQQCFILTRLEQCSSTKVIFNIDKKTLGYVIALLHCCPGTAKIHLRTRLLHSITDKNAIPLPQILTQMRISPLLKRS